MIRLKSLIIFTLSILTLLIVSFNNITITDEKSTETMSKPTKRVGMVIRLQEDMIDEYKQLHQNDNEGVRDLLTKYHLTNFNIFLHRLDDGNYYEFGYYEYTGDNFQEDMKNLAAEPRNRAWLEICDAMQIPLQGYESWAEMERIYYNP